MNLREAYAATSFANLQWSEISERPSDRVSASGLCDELGVRLWKIRYMKEKKYEPEAILKISLRLNKRSPALPELICFKIAKQCLTEYKDNFCKTCKGAKEMIVGQRRIVCEKCTGFGIRRWTDFERARGTGLGVNHVGKLQSHFRWGSDLLLTLDSKVNRQIEFYLGRNE